MKLNLPEGIVWLHPPHAQETIRIDALTPMPSAEIVEIWGSGSLQYDLVSRLLLSVNPLRQIETYPEIPDELCANLRAELMNRTETYHFEREEIDEIEQLVQDFTRPMIYAVIQYKLQAKTSPPDFQTIIETLHADTAWRQHPSIEAYSNEQLVEIYLLHSLAGPVGIEIVRSMEDVSDEGNRFLEDRSAQHPTIPFIERLAIALGEKLVAGPIP